MRRLCTKEPLLLFIIVCTLCSSARRVCVQHPSSLARKTQSAWKNFETYYFLTLQITLEFYFILFFARELKEEEQL